MTNQKPEIPIPTLDMHKEFVRRSKECKSIEEMLAKDGPMNFMFKDMIQALLAAEMTEHLGYERSDARSKHTDHARNGTFKKTLKTSTGEVEIEVPRDRKSEFEPTIVPKYQTKTSDLEKKMISMYAKGMTTTDISEHVSDLYLGADISPTFISQVTNKVLPLAKEWQSRWQSYF